MSSKEQTIRSTCRICYNNCGVLIHLRNGQPVNISGDPDNPMNKGRLCPKGLASLEYLNHPDRLKHPLQRVGDRGQNRWRRITWDQALDRVAENLNRIKATYGVTSIVLLRGASKGLLDDHLARFGNALGTPNISSPAPYCFIPMAHGARFTYGYYSYPDFTYPPACIVLWGSNPEATHFTDYEEILKARKAGTKLIVIDPLETELARTADLWLKPRPGTDLALALAWMQVMVTEGLYDPDFVAAWTIGFERLKKHLQDYSPEQMAAVTWVPADQIKAAARLYTTHRPACIGWGNGIETTINSFQTCRAVAMLRALSGNLGIPGGDVKFSAPGGLVKGNAEFVLQDNIPADVRSRRLSMQDGMMPIIYYALPQTVMRAILDDEPYPVRAAYVHAANPLTHYPHAAETRQAFEKLDFSVVADMFMTPTAQMADIVLPAASYLEADSVEQPWHYPIASVQQKVAQVGESWPDGRILNELTRKLGLTEFVWKDPTEPLNQVLQPAGISFDEFRNIAVLTARPLYRHFQREGFETPSKKVELYNSQLADWGFDPLPVYYEPPESPLSDPGLAQEYPLVLTSRKSEAYRHSGGRQIASLRRRRPDPLVHIHPDTAAGLGIEDGDWVRIATRRGAIGQQARLRKSLDPRVVEVDYAWWFPEDDPGGLYAWDRSNINILMDNRPPFSKEMGTPSMRGILCKILKDTN